MTTSVTLNMSRDRGLMLERANVQELSTLSVPKKYMCVTCAKQFDSFQALGGHRASHARIANVAVSANASSPPPPVASPSNKAKKLHPCPKCDEEFETGQALGGHMRRHRNDVPTDDKSENSDGCNDGKKRKILDFADEGFVVAEHKPKKVKKENICLSHHDLSLSLGLSGGGDVVTGVKIHGGVEEGEIVEQVVDEKRPEETLDLELRL